jgi:hypothetical protein
MLVDAVAYRPAIVKLTIWLPRWWNCDFVRLSMWLDDQWGAGYWDEFEWVPGGLCDACHRRAAWLQVGGAWDDEDYEGDEGEEPEYFDLHPVYLCFWCKPELGSAVRDDKATVNRALAEAGRASIAWRWRSRTPEELDR